MHIWSWVLPLGASGSCMVRCSYWQDSLLSPCGRTDVWASGKNPGATSGCLVGRGWSSGPQRGLGGFFVPRPPKAAGPQTYIHTYIHPDGTDHYPTSPATYSNTVAYALSLTAHTHTRTRTFPLMSIHPWLAVCSHSLIPFTGCLSSSPCLNCWNLLACLLPPDVASGPSFQALSSDQTVHSLHPSPA